MQAADTCQSDSGTQVPTVSPTVPTVPVPIGPNDANAQREWEHYQVTRGIERYKRSLVQEKEDGGQRTKRLDEIAPGNRVGQELFGPLAAAIRVKQAQFLEDMKSPSLKKVSEELAAFCALPADTLAACAVLTAMAASSESTYLGVSRDCGARVQHEIEYAMWRDAERAAAKERKASGAEFVPDLFKLMVKRNDAVDMRVFRKWSKKAPLFTSGDWDQKTKARVGGALMTMLVESNGWYEVKEEFQEGHNKTKLMFRMTEQGLFVLSRLHVEHEHHRPWMLPMICEPRDYEYIESEALSVDPK